MTILITLSPHLTVGGACHVTPVDLYDLVSRLQPPVTGHQAVREHLRHHVIIIMSSLSCHHYHVIMCDISHLSVTSWTTTHLRGVSAPPTMVTPRLAEVRGISTWLTSPSRIGSRVMPATTMRT